MKDVIEKFVIISGIRQSSIYDPNSFISQYQEKINVLNLILSQYENDLKKIEDKIIADQYFAINIKPLSTLFNNYDLNY